MRRFALYLVVALFAIGISFNLLYAQHESQQRAEANRDFATLVARTDCKGQNDTRQAMHDLWGSVAAYIDSVSPKSHEFTRHLRRLVREKAPFLNCVHPTKGTSP